MVADRDWLELSGVELQFLPLNRAKITFFQLFCRLVIVRIKKNGEICSLYFYEALKTGICENLLVLQTVNK